MNKEKTHCFFSLQTTKKINGSIEDGKRPFINYEGAPYRSEILSHSPHLIGSELTLLVNIKGIRIIRAFLPDGSEFGYSTVSGKWGIKPHSLWARKAILKLKKDKKIFFKEYDDPFQANDEYRVSQAQKHKRARLNHKENLDKQNKKMKP